MSSETPWKSRATSQPADPLEGDGRLERVVRRVLFVLGAIAVVGVGFALLEAMIDGPCAIDEAPILAPRMHRVTERMASASALKAAQTASPFRAPGSDGKTYVLGDLLKDGPLVLVFIKDGCPCSKSAEPFFRRLHASGRGWVRFLGVIDGDEDVARRWVAENGTPYSVLADPRRIIIHAYGAENSAYVALISPEGRIETLWPGYSAGMLRELGERMTRLAGRKLEDVDVSDAPEAPYSGCPFE
jgi:peroxiredoxin